MLNKHREIENICKELVEEVSGHIDAVSVVSNVIDNILEIAWSSYKVESAWRLLREDEGTLGHILTKIRELEEAKVCILEWDWMERAF